MSSVDLLPHGCHALPFFENLRTQRKLCMTHLFPRSVSRHVRIIENLEVDQDPIWWTQSPDIMLLNLGLCYNNVLMQKAIDFTRNAFKRSRSVGAKSRNLSGVILSHMHRIMSAKTLEFVVLPNIFNMLLVLMQLFIGYSFPIALLATYFYDTYYLAVCLVSSEHLRRRASLHLKQRIRLCFKCSI